MSQQKLIIRPVMTVTRKLAADVDAPYVPVVPTANEGEVAVADSQNAEVEGILCQTGKQGDLVPIVIDGIVPIKISAAVDRLDHLMTSANSMAFKAPLTSGTTYNVFGRALTKATVAEEFVSVQLTPGAKINIKA